MFMLLVCRGCRTEPCANSLICLYVYVSECLTIVSTVSVMIYILAVYVLVKYFVGVSSFGACHFIFGRSCFNCTFAFSTVIYIGFLNIITVCLIAE